MRELKARNAALPPLALVTGTSRGIGLAVTRMLLERGCRVVGAYGHDDAAAQKAVDSLGSLARNFTLVKTDLGHIEGVESLADKVESMGGGLTCLVSNVGITDKTPFGDVVLERWEEVIRTNLTIPFFLVQRLAGFMRDREGRIVFIGAVMGMRPHPMSYSYGVSKAGLHFLAQCLVKTMSPRGITVNVVAPGFVETAMQAGKARDHRLRIENRIALRRFACPEEVAAVVESLIQQEYVTGQILSVDGGYDFE
jgi:NAD(P)-dependent dehydrogenase (short-subunit alcohol dehydrogenase family)